MQAEQEKTATLQAIVQRLSSERRVADVLVTDQTRAATGELRTTLLFVEYDRHGDPLPARRFVIDGQVIHIDALVVKFDGKFVQENDSLRGHSVALFTRMYGEHQFPDGAEQIDQPGQIPPAYRGAIPASAISKPSSGAISRSPTIPVTANRWEFVSPRAKASGGLSNPATSTPSPSKITAGSTSPPRESAASTANCCRTDAAIETLRPAATSLRSA